MPGWDDARASVRTMAARVAALRQVLPWGRRPWLSFRLPGLIATP